MKNLPPRASKAQSGKLSRRDEARALFRNAILEAAEQVFGGRGYHQARIQDIAERARTAVGTVYNHFDDKEDVLRALVEERGVELVALFAPLETDPAGFAPGLTARLARMLRFIEDHRSFYAIALEHGLIGSSAARTPSLVGPRAAKRAEKMQAMFREIIERGIAEGALAPAAPAQVARFLAGVLRAFTTGSLQEQGEVIGDKAPLIVDLFLYGAAARPHAKAPRRA